MAAADIVIKGAREHNLRDIDLVIPRNQLVCLTGVSGSGKSSLAFDTLFAEGQRRYVESLSTFARQFLGQMPKPDVDLIEGLSPSISIAQKTAGQNPRSTVGTITEIYDFLRVLYARCGQGFCPDCGRPITAQTREQIIDQVAALADGTRFSILAPVARSQKGEHRDLFDDLMKQGFVRARVDGNLISLSDDLKLDRQMRHDIEVVIDRLVAGKANRARLAEAVDLAMKLGQGNLIVAEEEGKGSGFRVQDSDLGTEQTADDYASVPRSDFRAPTSDLVLSAHYACVHCRKSFEPPSPQLFSFNSPLGMCLTCDGLGDVYAFDAEKLIVDGGKSFQQGCFELIGDWRELGRWRKHIFQGVADTLEYKHGLDAGTILETPWEELDPQFQKLLLWGTGDLHVTYTWKHGGSVHKYGGKFEGIIPELLSKYKSSQSGMQRKQLEKFMSVVRCGQCNGARLNPQARSVRIATKHARFGRTGLQPVPSNEKQQNREGTGCNPVLHASKSLPEVCALAVSDAMDFFSELDLDPTRQTIAAEALKEIRGRLGFLQGVGLEYLSLDRTAPTLSGGEAQRIRLAGQVGCGLVGVLYILDEPSIGLHPRDNQRLLATLERLRDLGNTVVVVEHDEDTMRAADHVIDFGPGPGVRGGQVVAVGHANDIAQNGQSLTGKYLAGEEKIEVPAKRRGPSEFGMRNSECGIEEKKKPARRGSSPSDNSAFRIPHSAFLRIVGASHNNLKHVDVDIPLGCFVCVTGVSGSGKSSLVNDIIAETLWRDLNKGEGNPGKHERIEGLEQLDKLIAIDQSPIGRTPRSNPATYIKVFDEIRHLYTQLPEAKARGYKPGRFSFNVEGGRCEACEGNGMTKLEMDFLADVWVTCPVCQGHRFNRETLQMRFKGKSIAEVLEMDVQQALEHFANIPKIKEKLQTLHDVGLDYLKLGQQSPTLSGGEAQRIKLARELVKKSTGKTLYLLDEPTTGLHFADIKLLLKVLHDFVDAGNTVLVVEHNLDVIKTADFVIDLGPEGGAAGGQIVAQGTPEEVACVAGSHTGVALAPLLDAETWRRGDAGNGKSARNGISASPRPRVSASSSRVPASLRRPLPASSSITVRGAREHNLKDVSVEIPRDQLTVFCGPSGSGKTSLAMDTIYAEGQRRYVESLSSYARQFVSQMQKPQVEHIEGLSPAIAIEQKTAGHSPRSTVGTVTEIYDYLRILFARMGQPYCPACNLPIGTQTVDEIVDKVMDHLAGTRMYLMAPVEVRVGESYDALWAEMRESGYARVRIDGATHSLDSPPAIDRRRKHDVQIVIDRIEVKADARRRIADSVENALAVGRGVIHTAYADPDLPEEKWETKVYSQHFSCDKCGRSFDPLTPHNFSFNSALGWCPACEGLGKQTGTNPAALVADEKLSLAEGAVALFPAPTNPLFQAMLAAFCRHTGIPADRPFDQFTARQRRTIFHGCGEEWISVTSQEMSSSQPASGGRKSAGSSAAKKSASSFDTLFKFQYKGLYPALEEAARVSPSLRSRLDHLVDEIECSECGGSRLRDDAAAVRFKDQTIDDIGRTALGELSRRIDAWKLSTRERKIAGEVLREVKNRVQFLVDVGLEYLTLARPAPTLSGGESQRIRLASQVGSGLTGVLYVLDEPTIGLHPRDNARLIKALLKLRDLGNTLLLVEHDKEVVESADKLLDFGPGAGRHGGQIVADGPPQRVAKQNGSVTGPYLSGKKAIPIPSNRRIQEKSEVGTRKSELKKDGKKREKKAAGSNAKSNSSDFRVPRSDFDSIEILGARHNNLRNLNVRIPLGVFTCVTGVSGSGKSSLVNDILFNAVSRVLHRSSTYAGAHDEIKGIQHINKVIRVDQQPLGNTPTSNPATYTGVFDLIRSLFAQLPEAKVRGYTARRFSFNVPGGRCEKCEGAGQLRIEMHFLPDVWVECDTCRGKRYNPETLAVRFHEKNVSDVLEMQIAEAVELFKNIPKIRRILQMLCDVGLGYLTLGQAAPTLSGGEAQRVKLAAELARPDTGRTLYLLDEPTTGLHYEDLAKLLDVLNRLVDLGNTVLVIEHNLDVIKTADWVIDLGPEAGEGGGYVVAEGTPEEIVERALKKPGKSEVGTRNAELKRKSSKSSPRKESSSSEFRLPTSDFRSHTATCLAPVLAAGPYQKRAVYNFAAAEEKKEEDLDITEVGKEVQMPWEIDGRRWHTQERVGRQGEPCRWDGEIVARVVDKIHELGEFSPTDWAQRTVVEIAAEKKTEGWFFHALTGEEWLVKLKFRVAKKTFKADELIARLGMKPLNEMPDLPVYGSEPRVKCKNLRGPWQEVDLSVHSFDEIDTPEFWKFMEQAVAGFNKFSQRLGKNPDDVMPWKVLGQKWHLSRRGFPPGKKIDWPVELLEELCELLTAVAPQGQFLWNNQQVVNVFVAGQQEAWATIHTKKVAGIDLVLTGPKDGISFGRVAHLAAERELITARPDRDTLKLRFTSLDDLHNGDLKAALVDHLEAVGAVGSALSNSN